MPELQQEKPLNELLSRSMVDLYIGSQKTHWTLHEKLLCYHSLYFRQLFSKPSENKSHTLPDEEDPPFKMLVGWLYSSSLPIPREEADLTNLLDVYLMAEKFQISSLVQDALQVVREWYKYNDTYPGLRRVQYVYANSEEGSPMRTMMVGSVARMLVLDEGIKMHWDKALRKNGVLAVDIIRAIQDWRIEEELVPDAREEPIEEEGEEEEEEEGEEEGEEGDESEKTVVESPRIEHKVQNGVKNKSGDVVSGIDKLGLKEVPNGITNGDYGTLH